MSSGRDSLAERSRAQSSKLIAHYERALLRHGPTAQGMNWKDSASQQLRFEVLCGVCDLAGKSVHEVGAGAGHLASHLSEKAIAADYSGSDLSEKMIEAARKRHPEIPFEVRDAQAVGDDDSYDVVLCSGLFHVKLDRHDDAWQSFVNSTIRSMFEACRVGIAFNLMSDRVDYRNDQLYYSNPEETLRFCLSEFGRHAVLRHDYPLYEYTVYVYRGKER